MAEELGSLAVKIGLDSSGFQNGISNINRNLRVLDSEFKANTAALGENAKGIEGLKLKSDYESWMPDFMSGLAEGINKSKYVVSEAIKGLSLDMKVNTKLTSITTPTNDRLSQNKDSNRSIGFTLHIENFINNTEKDIEQLAYELEFYRQRIAMGKGGV